jgi:hypothetical protein
MHEFTGSTIPFPDAAEERKATNDPRRSISERYATRDAYVAAIREAAERLVAERLMIAEDIDRVAAAAADWGAPRHDVRLK